MVSGAPLRIVMLGPPGAGKGTQAVTIAKDNGIPHISTGELFRAAIRDGTELGKQIQKTYDSGTLISDELVISIVRDRITQEDCAGGFLLDGCVRTVAQAIALDEMLLEVGQELTHVIDIDVPEAVLLERIRLRASGRSDDTPEVAVNRLRIYREQTAPVTKYYLERHAAGRGAPLLAIDGLGTVEEVRARIGKVLRNGA